MFLYIYYQQTHPSRNIISYLLSGEFNKIKILKNNYKQVDIICKKWKSINYEYLERLLKNNYSSSNLEEIIKKIYPEVTVILYYPHNRWNVKFTEIFANTSFKKIIYIDDMHTNTKSKANFNLCNKFDKILASYAYKLPEILSQIDINKVISFPHYVPDHMLIQNNNKKSLNKILLPGVCTGCNWNCDKWRRLSYDVRYNIFDQYKYHNWLDTLCIHKNITGINFYKLINKYNACISTPGNIGYIVAKYFEIPASKSILLAYNEGIEAELEKLGFIDGVNYIGFNKQNFGNKVNSILNKKINVSEIQQNGQNLIMERHLLSHRIKLLDEICENLIKEK